MGGNRGFVLCSAREWERRGACALQHQVYDLQHQGMGGEQGVCALQRQGRGEERGLCFGAPGKMGGNRGVVLCSGRGAGKRGGEQGGCALQRQGSTRVHYGKKRAPGCTWENSKCTRVPYGKTQSAPRQS